MSGNISHNPSNSPSPLPPPLHEYPDSQLAEHQLLAELAKAAESPMVSTRSHDHELEDLGKITQAKEHASVTSPRKRKFESHEGNPSSQTKTKRPKAKTDISVHSKGQDCLPHRKVDKSVLAREIESEEQGIEDGSTPASENKGDSVSVKHKRFGSEDVEATSALRYSEPTSMNQEEQSQGEEDSDDDDAPEAITAAAGFEASRATAADASRIAELQKITQRAKRRDLDARLKAQAEAVKSRRQPEASKKSKKTKLPDLLPDDLLATEPLVRPPTPPSSPETRVVSKKTKIHDSDPKPPKDIKRGGKIIRVLQAETSVLPPKSSGASKTIREAWLLGQRRVLGGSGVPRRKMGSGFVRK